MFYPNRPFTEVVSSLCVGARYVDRKWIGLGKYAPIALVYNLIIV